MKIITAATNKGGEGKTKTSILIAEFFCKEKNKRCLAIDLDPQSNFSNRFLKMEMDPAAKEGKVPPIHPDYNPSSLEDNDWDGRSSIADIFYGIGITPYPTYIEKLDFAPAHAAKLLEAEAVTKHDVVEQVHLQLKRFLNLPELQELYDLVIIDTPPSKGPLTRAALKASSHVLIPAQMEQFSVEGIYGMLQLWKQETYCRDESDPLELIGILPNKLRNINIHKAFLEDLRNQKGISKYIMPITLKERAIYKEVDIESASPNTIFDLPDSHVAKQEAIQVCNYLYKRIFEDE